MEEDVTPFRIPPEPVFAYSSVNHGRISHQSRKDRLRMSKLSCPFHIRTSHGRNEIGFASKQEFLVTGSFSVPNAVCLGVTFKNFSLHFSGGASHTLILESVTQSKDDLVNFLDKLEAALTTYFGVQDKNPYYGSPYVEFDRFNLNYSEDAPAQDPSNPHRFYRRVGLSTKISKKSTENLPFSEESIKGLSHNGISQLYADGLRATSPQSKFFHWFIILEEFLEKNKQLNNKFVGLFTNNEIESLRKFSESFRGNRKKSTILGVRHQTIKARHEKLSEILHEIGISKLTIMTETRDITPELCQSLIKQRNDLFHRGTHVNEGLLYGPLFQIVTELAKRSEAILGMRDSQEEEGGAPPPGRPA